MIGAYVFAIWSEETRKTVANGMERQIVPEVGRGVIRPVSGSVVWLS